MRKGMILAVGILGVGIVLGGAWALQEKKEGFTPPIPLEDEYLDRLVGEWDVTGRILTGDEGQAFAATESYEWVLNHQFLLLRYEMPGTPGKPGMSGMGLIRSRPETLEYDFWWFSSYGEGQHYQGKREENALTLHHEGPKGKVRMTFSRPPEGITTFTVEVMKTGETEYVTTLKSAATKKGS